jgi:hypothetical protein
MARGPEVAMNTLDYDHMEKVKKKARKKHPRIGKHEKMAESYHAKADMQRAMGDMHNAKARAMLMKVTQVMSKSEK